MSLMVYEAQKPYEEEVHPHLNRMNPGLGASYAFHCGDGSTIQRTDGNQTGVGWIMSSECKREAQTTLYPLGKEHLQHGRFCIMSQALHIHFVLSSWPFY